MHDALHDKGLVGLAYYELGFRQITNSLRPIHTVADLQGLKLRVIPTPLNLDWVRALGAQAVPIPFPDVYAALETKAVDGQDNPVTVIDANRFDRVQKYLLLSRHQYNPQSVLISKKVWDGLDAAHRSMLADAARESAAFQRGRARSMEGAALENLRKHGMVVTRLPDGEARKMADLLRPVTDKTLKALPPGVVAGLKQARGASTGK
jgi:TRAP-type C4-dicarboxylate transport system substrate-binding protein